MFTSSRLEQLKLEKDTSKASAPPLEKLLDDLPSPPKVQPNASGRRSGMPPPASRGSYRGQLHSQAMSS